ncbi:MAG: ADP-forming succinate--CoA ligase subunit beta [Alphaproteobacteria bacterium]|nr:ADP-forming succinate--CoA ligase subunit beta [Alphaproteobacteria bacterium]
MNIHEYQAKRILKRYGINIPKGDVAYTPIESRRVASRVSSRGPWMLKAQIQSSARKKGYFLEKRTGSGGGIRKIQKRTEIIKNAEQMLGSTLVTIQTGPKGKTVSRLYVEAYSRIEHAFYLGLAVDRVNATLTLLAANTAGDDITNLAINHPEKILRLPLALEGKTNMPQVKQVMEFLKLSSKSGNSLKRLINGIHRIFLDYDATMVEINPVGVLKNGILVALDAKISFDDNALYRHPEIKRLQDDDEANSRELLAAKYKFGYSEFDGSVGCIVNGDGIALASMDMLSKQGVGTACFLNVKGGVDKDKIASGIKIIVSNPKVEGILINILGGFLRCNLIADGIVAAASEVGLNVPLVVRFEGTNKEEAQEILAESKLPIVMADNMEDAVKILISKMEAME